MAVQADGAGRAESAIGRLTRDPSYLCIWGIGGLTGVVRWLQLLAMGIYTFEITHSPLLVSLVPVFWMLPLTVLGPIVGALADRLDRKLMLAASMVMIVAVSTVMAVLSHLGQLPYLYIAVASLLSGIFWATDMPIRRRLLGDLSQGALSAAMSLDSATGNATRMAGPLLGGVMLQMVGITGVFVLSAVVYSGCLVLLFLARLPAAIESVAKPALGRELIGGVLFVLSQKKLRRILAITIVFNVWGFSFTSMIPILGKERLGLDPSGVGAITAMEGLGAFVGAMLVAFLARPQWFYRIYFGGTALYLVGVLYLGVLSHVAGGPFHSLVIVTLALVVIGMCSACFAAMQGTLTYMSAPPAYRSRVMGVLTLCIGTGPLGFFHVGWLAETYGVSWALTINGLEGLVILALMWIWGDNSLDMRNIGAAEDTPKAAP